MKDQTIIIPEHVMEIRYPASGSFLDVRGQVADYIKNNDILPHWRIETNHIQFQDKQDRVNKFGAIAGYKSASYYALNPDTKSVFKDQAIKYWKTLVANDFYDINNILRFGCRSKIFIGCSKKFEEINDTLKNKIFSTNISSIVGNDIIDTQSIFVVNTSDLTYKVICGPLHKDEARRYFSFDSDHFSNTGIFLDIDVYKNEDVQLQNIASLLKKAIDITNKLENVFVKEVVE